MRGLVLMLVVMVAVACAAPVWGQQSVVFYDDFESGDTSGWWAPARVGETGQVTCWDAAGAVIACAGTGQDGDKRGGVAWPNPRFVDNGDGTVTDMLTGLVWLKDASCFGTRTWVNALADANGLASDACGLTDGSVAGDWRLPGVNEFLSLAAYEYWSPAVSNAAGTAQWTDGDAFYGVQDIYWSSTSVLYDTQRAFYMDLWAGGVGPLFNKTDSLYVWPVRGGFTTGDTSGWWAPARVGETGQVTCWDESGTVIPCAGTGQDGDKRGGVAWPNPRFVDNGDGTVTDMLTGLVWLKDANCFGTRTWVNALAEANGLASGACGLTDGSLAGVWRLPSVKELQSLISYEWQIPALSNAAGTAQWTEDDPFTGVQSYYSCWSSSSGAYNPQRAATVDLPSGSVVEDLKTYSNCVWPVRAGQ